MMRLASTLLTGLIVIAQLDDTARPVRCWVLDGVPVAHRAAQGPGPFWLSHDPVLGGWMEWQPVRNGDRDGAARAVGFRSAAECGR